MVRLRCYSSIDLVTVQAEDFVLSGFHGFWNHQPDKFIQRSQLLAVLWLGFSSLFVRCAVVPDIDKGKSLECIENQADPFRKAGKIKATEWFAKRKISNKVESGPDVPFEQVDWF